MTNTPQAMDPKRVAALGQINQLFSTLHEFLQALRPLDADGKPQDTKLLDHAHVRVDEAAMWAMKSVALFGCPDLNAPANDGKPDESPPADGDAAEVKHWPDIETIDPGY